MFAARTFCMCCGSESSIHVIFFFFKQKTAYEMRISDWSSDVCSSDLGSGARLIFTCGFDSVPSDLGVFFLQELARERFGAPAKTVKGRIRRLVGGLSGGTLASGRARDRKSTRLNSSH